MHRGQLDLVDKSADPDGDYCWIGHYIDHYTKFNFFWPQINESADEVAHNLTVHVFSVVGLPSILQHDNGREFCNAVIRKIEKGSFVTVRIPIVDRASGDLPRVLCRVDDIIGKDASLYKLSCEFGVLNACYDMSDIELLTHKVETSHWKKEEISLQNKQVFLLQAKDVNAREHA
jgi:hypothetical protein